MTVSKLVTSFWVSTFLFKQLAVHCTNDIAKRLSRSSLSEYLSKNFHPSHTAVGQDILQQMDLNIDVWTKVIFLICQASNRTVLAHSRSTAEQEKKGGGIISV